MLQILALPSDNPGGPDADISSHFGHCDCFTLIGIENGSIKTVSIVPNLPENQNGCMAMAEFLNSQNVSVVIAGKKGMGMRSLWCLRFANIEIFMNHDFNKVRAAVEAFMQNRLTVYRYDETCQSGTGKCF